MDLSVCDRSDGVLVTASTPTQVDTGVEVTIPPKGKAATNTKNSIEKSALFLTLPGVLDSGGPGVGHAGFERNGF